jgi:hypothetical protein
VVVGSVFIGVFALSGIFFHLRAFHTYGYKFQWSLLLFAFCVVRILAIGFRIALKDNLTSKVLACITQILLAAGLAFLVRNSFRAILSAVSPFLRSFADYRLYLFSLLSISK